MLDGVYVFFPDNWNAFLSKRDNRGVIWMQIDFETLQEAFVREVITLEQFIDILNDNFGHIVTKQIIKRNLKLARKKEREAMMKEKSNGI